MSDLPIILTTSGALPTPPATLRAAIVNLVAAQDPGFTANLPGSMVEDITSTEVMATVLTDGARVELINSIDPYGANEFLLNQLGQQTGLMLGQPTNTSVNVVFSGTIGYPINQGFLISDGNFQYAVQFPGTVIGSSGSSAPVTAIAILPGSWPVPAGTVTQLVTSVPSSYTVTVNNPLPGTPGNINPETWASYRSRVILAGRAAAVGMPSFIRTLLMALPGIVTRSVSIQTPSAGQWTILCSGAELYATAFAILTGVGDPSTLVASENYAVTITQAAEAVITTSLYHGLAVGQTATIAGANPTQYDGNYPILSVQSDYQFTTNVNTSTYPDYVGDTGLVTPNPRNQAVSIPDPPDNYIIQFATPLTQTVGVTCTWNTTLSGFTGAAAMQQSGIPAIAGYVNALPTGAPINLFELAAVFQAATAAILPNNLLTRLIFEVSIDGTGVSPEAGTGIVQGDTQSLLNCPMPNVTVTQG